MKNNVIFMCIAFTAHMFCVKMYIMIAKEDCKCLKQQI